MADDLGTWLVQHGVLTPDKLEEALQQQIIYGGGLDTALLELGLALEDVLLTGMGEITRLPVARREDLMAGDIAKLKVIPAKLSQKYRMVPFKLGGRALSVALIHLPELSILEDIGFMLSLHLIPHVALEVRVHEAMQRLYGAQIPARSMAVLAQLTASSPPQPTREPWVAQEPAKRMLSTLPQPVAPGGDGDPGGASENVWHVTRPQEGPLSSTQLGPGATREIKLHPARAVSPLLGGAKTELDAAVPDSVEDFPSKPPETETLAKDPLDSLPPLSMPPPDKGEEEQEGPTSPAPLPAEKPEPVVAPEPMPPEQVPTAPGGSPPPAAQAEPAASESPRTSTEDGLPFPSPESRAALEAMGNREDPEIEARIAKRSHRTKWDAAAARAELATAVHRDDVVEVLLRFAHQSLEYAAVFVLQGGHFIGWDSIGPGQRPRGLGSVRIESVPGTALEVVARTGSSFLGPLKPSDPLPRAVGRINPRVVLLVPFFVKERLVGVLYGERGRRGIPAATVADLQTLTPDLGRTLERLIRDQKRIRLSQPGEPSPVPSPQPAPLPPTQPPLEVGPPSLPATEPPPVEVQATEPPPVEVQATEPLHVEVQATEPPPVEVQATEPPPVEVQATEPPPVEVPATPSASASIEPALSSPQAEAAVASGEAAFSTPVEDAGSAAVNASAAPLPGKEDEGAEQGAATAGSPDPASSIQPLASLEVESLPPPTPPLLEVEPVSSIPEAPAAVEVAPPTPVDVTDVDVDFEEDGDARVDGDPHAVGELVINSSDVLETLDSAASSAGQEEERTDLQESPPAEPTKSADALDAPVEWTSVPEPSWKDLSEAALPPVAAEQPPAPSVQAAPLGEVSPQPSGNESGGDGGVAPGAPAPVMETPLPIRHAAIALDVNVVRMETALPAPRVPLVAQVTAPPADWTGWPANRESLALAPETWSGPVRPRVPTLKMHARTEDASEQDQPAPPSDQGSQAPAQVEGELNQEAAPAPEPVIPPPTPEPVGTDAPKPPPLPPRRKEVPAPDGLGAEATPHGTTGTQADEMIKQADNALPDQLAWLAQSLVELPPDPDCKEMIQRACVRGKDGSAALELLANKKGLAVAEALKLFPGKLTVDVFGNTTSRPEACAVSPLCTVLVRLGPGACALAVAAGVNSPDRDTRYVAVLLALETTALGVAGLVVERLFDSEPRIRYLAAEVMDRLRTMKDRRADVARAALSAVGRALKDGPEEHRLAAARAAIQIHERALVPLLIEVLDAPSRELNEAALEALKEHTKQDFGLSSKRWRKWWTENSPRSRVEWLIDALEHKERELRLSAQRELNQITGEYLGFYYDAPKSERDAAVERWRAWYADVRKRLELT